MAVVVTGGLRLGMTMARANWRALCGSTLARVAPSRRCKCQSSGRAMVMLSGVFSKSDMAAGFLAIKMRIPPFYLLPGCIPTWTISATNRTSL